MTKWSKDALNGQYFQKFTQSAQEINLKFSGIPEKFPQFPFSVVVFIVVVFLLFFVVFGWPTKTSSKLDRIGNSGTKLDKVWQNWGQTQNTVKCDENYEKWGVYIFLEVKPT